MLDIPFDTARLRIREFERNDVGAIIALAALSDSFTFYSLRPNRDTSLAEIGARATRLVDYAIATREEGAQSGFREHFKLAVCLKTDRAKGQYYQSPVGYVALDDASRDTRDIGYFIDPAFQGQGYASEAVAGLLCRFFNATNYSHVSLTVHPDNLASQGVARHMGFRHVGETTMQVNCHVEPRLQFRLDRDRPGIMLKGAI